MFFYLEGNVVQKHDTFFVLDIQGVGFKIYTSHSTLNCLSQGEKTMIYTYTYVREDALDVFGFLSLDELSFFEKLLNLNHASSLGIITISNIVMAFKYFSNSFFTRCCTIIFLSILSYLFCTKKPLF